MKGIEIVLATLCLLLCYGLGGFAGYAGGYEDGQVDAINGEIKYELVLQKNGATEWQKKK